MLMLEEVLDTVSQCKLIDKIIIVSKDEAALKLGRPLDVVEIFDDESGVNNAIHLADQYTSEKKFDCSIIFPQDIPLMKSIDIDNLLGFVKSENSVIVVPSRQFNGTNALVRCPANIIDTARTKTKNISVALIRRIMLDIDDESDLAFMLKQKDNPDLCNKIKSCL